MFVRKSVKFNPACGPIYAPTILPWTEYQSFNLNSRCSFCFLSLKKIVSQIKLKRVIERVNIYLIVKLKCNLCII